MLKDTKSLGNNNVSAWESRGVVIKKRVCILTHPPHVVIICTQDVLQLILTLYSLVVILRLDIAPKSVSAK